MLLQTRVGPDGLQIEWEVKVNKRKLIKETEHILPSECQRTDSVHSTIWNRLKPSPRAGTLYGPHTSLWMRSRGFTARSGARRFITLVFLLSRQDSHSSVKSCIAPGIPSVTIWNDQYGSTPKLTERSTTFCSKGGGDHNSYALKIIWDPRIQHNALF
jgi:hypothetical protein